MGVESIRRGGVTMSILSQIFSKGASTLVDSVGKILDNVITTKEEKSQLDIELLKSEQQFQLDMRKLSNDEKAMVLGDISSARDREVKLNESQNTTKLNKNLMPIMAIGTIVIVLGLFYVLVFTPSAIKSESKDVIIYILGVLSAVLTQIYNYYFGSSAGSMSKDRTIAGLKGN